ncbi:type II toxin-antitoxin system Rv0910 family toxin [Hoyosella subflava]|nr:crotonase/enoyl-CoA hydratase family protein [Hoyosella subflava]
MVRQDPLMPMRTARIIGEASVRSLLQREAAPHSAAPTEAHFSRDFAHTFGETALVTAQPDEIMERVLDFKSFGKWFTLHADWPNGAPAQVTSGSQYTEDVRVLGTPARVQWTVTHYAPPAAFAIEGTGPMGTSVGIWFGAKETPAGTELSVTGGFHSDALKGPMGSLVASTLQSATKEALGNLTSLVTGAPPEPSSTGQSRAVTRQIPPPSGPRPKPVLHAPSGKLVDPWAPVLVGIGQTVHRPDSADTIQSPLELAAHAARIAIKDAGNARLLDSRVRVSAVSTVSWAYGDDQAALLARQLGIDDAELVQSAPLGGDAPQRLVSDAAQSISEGQLDVAIIAGAEAFASLAIAQKSGAAPKWDRPHSGAGAPRRVGSDRPGNNEAENAAGLLTPAPMYALMESALRGALKRDIREHVTAISSLWSRFSAAATKNRFAWLPEYHSPERIADHAADNRPIASPYTKLMTANLTVDQGAALVLCSADSAAAAGIPPQHWVFIHAAAHAEEEWYVSERHSIAEVPAIGAAARAALAHAGLTIDDVTHLDLYSCFPFAVEAAAQQLSLPLDDPARPLTQTGGLTFAGGPLNNYSTHGIAALATQLRNEPAAYGLATALGWYATKHAIGIYSAQPPREPFRQIDAGLRMRRPPKRRVCTSYSGEALVEGYTVTYQSNGSPEALIVSGIAVDGDRVLARTTEAEYVALGEATDLLDTTFTLTDGAVSSLGAHRNTSTGTARDRLLSTAAAHVPSLTVEWDGPLCVITLNRPQVRNAIDLALALEIERAIDTFEADPDARVAILRGAGTDFCTGMDLKAAAKGQFPVTPRRGLLGLTGTPPVKPVIAAVEGNALAGGFELALACDLVVAAEDALFGLPEARRGLVAAAGGVLRLAQRLPRAIALELAYTGAPISAQRAYELGLINRLCAPGDAAQVARNLANVIAESAPLSVELSKRIVDESPGWPVPEAFGRQSEIASAASFSDDAAEGICAFDEKRAPRWSGR